MVEIEQESSGSKSVASPWRGGARTAGARRAPAGGGACRPPSSAPLTPPTPPTHSHLRSPPTARLGVSLL